MSCGWPDNFCICYSLPNGGKCISVLCILTSVVTFILMMIYLCADFDNIAHEIADNSDEMVERLKENRTCKLFGIQIV